MGLHDLELCECNQKEIVVPDSLNWTRAKRWQPKGEECLPSSLLHWSHTGRMEVLWKGIDSRDSCQPWSCFLVEIELMAYQRNDPKCLEHFPLCFICLLSCQGLICRLKFGQMLGVQVHNEDSSGTLLGIETLAWKDDPQKQCGQLHGFQGQHHARVCQRYPILVHYARRRSNGRLKIVCINCASILLLSRKGNLA
jgi:hypothetical protein